MTKLYPSIEPFDTQFLNVSDRHTLYVEQSGNPDGKPVVFLHGGPGGGTLPLYRQFFDPTRWRIVMFDQRGCGKSTPFAELQDNSTWDLVADIELIREHLGISRWAVFGGSWGRHWRWLMQAHILMCVLNSFCAVFFCSGKKKSTGFIRKAVQSCFPISGSPMCGRFRKMNVMILWRHTTVA